jgi:transcriptional regulator with XRE-family HTH domain
MASLGEILRTFRKERGLTQRELGHAVGRTQTEIQRWETSAVRIPANELLPLSQALGISVEQFFTDTPIASSTAEPVIHA